MIQTITARNVNTALSEGLHRLRHTGIITGSRNGPVLVAPGPVVTAYTHPTERVLWSLERDCNPFFHLFESMWMLAGRNDTATLKPLVPRMQDFSDDQQTLNGAYGFRWREYFGYDQIKEIVQMLKKDPNTRRAVLSMWNAYDSGGNSDTVDVRSDLLNQGSKDLPCNTHIYFDASRGYLDMTVCNRSNDAIWGAYGANSVHMSFLHEFVASAAGLLMGTYYQMSNNFHIYIDRADVQRLIKCGPEYQRDYWEVRYAPLDLYPSMAAEARVLPLLAGNEADSAAYFLREMEDWCASGGHLANPVYSFTRNVLNPVMEAHRMYKGGARQQAYEKLLKAPPSDWRTAALRWIAKRMAQEKQTV